MKTTLVSLLCLTALINTTINSIAQPTEGVLKLAVAGATHGHVGWILGRKNKSDVALVGVYEPDKELAQRYIKQYSLSPNIFYTDMARMLDDVKPEAVVAFGSIYEHMEVVEACAPRGIHVMVEKPLATTNAHASRMHELAKKHKIYLLTNYETSWYPTTEKTYRLVNDSSYVGKIRKVVIRDGHQGPKEIGVGKEFLDWLTDPLQNGGGALIDFGCYGANIMTYLMKGAEPLSVTAVTQQLKPAIYPNVDDDATIVVAYPDAQCVIQASWNWPFGRKDMDVYGETGYILVQNNTKMHVRNAKSGGEKSREIALTDVGVYQDPFSYFADVVKGKIQLPKNGLYSLENNMTVVRILDAARESARTGKTVYFKKK